jgi:hypothetical protein
MAKPNLISEDRATSRLSVVEVKETIAERDRAFFMQQLRAYARALGHPKTIYYVLVDGENIRFYEETDAEPRLLGEFDTRYVLRPYVGEAVEGHLSEFTLAGLTMAWMRDIASHWKEQNPPGGDRIKPDIVDLLEKADVHAA